MKLGFIGKKLKNLGFFLAIKFSTRLQILVLLVEVIPHQEQEK